MENNELPEADSFVRTIAQVYALKGDALTVSILASANTIIKDVGWQYEDRMCNLILVIPTNLYSIVFEDIEQLEGDILQVAQKIWRGLNLEYAYLSGVDINAQIVDSPDWQSKALDWVNGKGVTNQGRVRSNNIASRECDGLLFRSQPEIFLYKALKSLGVSFAPLPVVLRGGSEYKRIEPDFVVFHDVMFTIVEVDGDTFHKESPAEAQARITLLEDEGAYIIPDSNGI